MEKEKLTITVSGTTLSGKSRLSFLLKEFLKANGFDVKQELSSDYTDEKHYDKQMSEKFHPIMDFIKEQRQIVIKEEQVKNKIK
jgi:hypothetical protein